MAFNDTLDNGRADAGALELVGPVETLERSEQFVGETHVETDGDVFGIAVRADLLDVPAPAARGAIEGEQALLVERGEGLTTINLAVIEDVDLLPYLNQGAPLTATASGRQPTKTSPSMALPWSPSTFETSRIVPTGRQGTFRTIFGDTATPEGRNTALARLA